MGELVYIGDAQNKRNAEAIAAAAFREEALQLFEGNARSIRELLQIGAVEVGILNAAGKPTISGRVVRVAPDCKSIEVQLRSGSVVTATGDDFSSINIATLPGKSANNPPPPPPVPPLRLV